MRPPSRGDARRQQETSDCPGIIWQLFLWFFRLPHDFSQKPLFHLSWFVLGFLSLATQSLDEQKLWQASLSTIYVFKTSKVYGSRALTLPCSVLLALSTNSDSTPTISDVLLQTHKGSIYKEPTSFLRCLMSPTPAASPALLSFFLPLYSSPRTFFFCLAFCKLHFVHLHQGWLVTIRWSFNSSLQAFRSILWFLPQL